MEPTGGLSFSVKLNILLRGASSTSRTLLNEALQPQFSSLQSSSVSFKKTPKDNHYASQTQEAEDIEQESVF